MSVESLTSLSSSALFFSRMRYSLRREAFLTKHQKPPNPIKVGRFFRQKIYEDENIILAIILPAISCYRKARFLPMSF